MKTKLSTLLIVCILCIGTACTSYKNYVTGFYYQKASSNTKIAILPVQFKLSGVATNKMTSQEKRTAETREAKRFQHEITSRIVRQMSNKKKGINVNLQDILTTNSKLQNSGLEIHDTFDKTASELASILGVDAVMRTTIESNQLFSNDDAELIQTGARVLDILVPDNPISRQWWLSTGEIEVHSYITDASSEKILWSLGSDSSMSVYQTPEETLDRICHRFSKRFPYRNRDY